MNPQPPTPARSIPFQTFCVESDCSFPAVRESARIIRDWLASCQIDDSDSAAWELALVEAANNAVEHAVGPARDKPVRIEILLGDFHVEARVFDNTPGFDFPSEVDLPDAEAEGGRGIFLIKSLTESSEYLRSPTGNILRLRRPRTVPTGIVPAANPADLELRLADAEQALTEMSEELASSYEILVAMFRYSAELGSHANLAEFAQRLVTDLLQLTETDVLILRLNSNGQLDPFLAHPPSLLPQLSSLSLADSPDWVEVDAARNRENVWFGSQNLPTPADPISAIGRIGMGLVHPFRFGDRCLGTITVIRTQRENPLSSAKVNILQTLGDFLAIQITNSRLLDERTKSRITRHELEIAANIQRSLLPVSLPSPPPFEISASCSNAGEVGGDFYDVLHVGNSGLLFVIADVMGKGVPAALFAAVVRTAIRSIPSLFTDPAALLASVNYTLCDDLARVDMFVTAKLVYLDLRNQVLASASAGHCPLLVWRPGLPEALVIDNAGLPLGIEPDTRYALSVTPLPKGAVALLHTDGITELRDPKGNMFGTERLQGLLPSLAPGLVAAHQINDRVFAELDSFRAKTAPTDDQTFIVLRNAS